MNLKGPSGPFFVRSCTEYREDTEYENRMETGCFFRARLPKAVTELVMYTLKTGRAALFGGLLLIDLRNILFLRSIILFWRTKIWFTIGRHYWMPLPLAAFLSSCSLWLAGNIGTATKIWVYTGQMHGEMVSFAKMGSW